MRIEGSLSTRLLWTTGVTVGLTIVLSVAVMAWNSARTLALYRDMVNRAMQAASSRAAYCDVIQKLERMKGNDEGRKIIADLAEQWRRDYKRKCALLDELQKAGY